jgi:hypothetical protein
MLGGMPARLSPLYASVWCCDLVKPPMPACECKEQMS